MADLKYALFLGCVIPYREVGYEVSSRKVAETLGIQLLDMPDANCCGLPLDPANHKMMMVLATRDLCVAENLGLNIMTLCNGCTGVLRKVNQKLKQDKGLREEINGYLKEINMEFQGKIEVKHFVHVLSQDIGLDALKPYIKRPLEGLKIAPFHGCHIFRPSKYMDIDDPEDPSLLHDLVNITGATSVKYVDELQCCGASCAGIDSKVPLHLSREKFRSVKASGADAMVTICPSCHVVLDANQPLTERSFSESYKIPVFHYTQLLGLAMGLPLKELAVDLLRVKALNVLARIPPA
jgi:heterodisulfide reductase subunit B